MAESADMILPMLKETRAEIADFREAVTERLDNIEKAQRSFKQALSADSLMTRLLTGEFEERIENLEKYSARIKKFEKQVRAFEGRS